MQHRMPQFCSVRNYNAVNCMKFHTCSVTTIVSGWPGARKAHLLTFGGGPPSRSHHMKACMQQNIRTLRYACIDCYQRETSGGGCPVLPHMCQEGQCQVGTPLAVPIHIVEQVQREGRQGGQGVPEPARAWISMAGGGGLKPDRRMKQGSHSNRGGVAMARREKKARKRGVTH